MSVVMVEIRAAPADCGRAALYVAPKGALSFLSARVPQGNRSVKGLQCMSFLSAPRDYLAAKRDRLGHKLPQDDLDPAPD
jgi:hypothetical protein